MRSRLSPAFIALAAISSIMIGPPSVSATPAAQIVTASVGGVAQSAPRPTPKPITVTPSPASTTPACAFSPVSFNGAAYCPATIVGVRGTVYGTGTRVVLKGVTVTAVTTSTVTVAAWTSPPCSPGKFCGQLLTLESLTVPWTGTSRPAYGDVLDAFGRTITGTITPVGYIKTGYCPIDWC